MANAKVVAISGAAGGLGPTVVRAFFDAGASLALAGRSEEKLVRLLDSLGVPADRRLAMGVDLGNAAAAQAWADSVKGRFGRVDAVLHLVGGYKGGASLAEVSLSDWDELEGMLVGTTLCVVRAFAGILKNGGGRFIGVTSPKAQAPTGKSALYSMAKAASDALVLALADELRGTGSTANLVVVDSIDVAGKPYGKSTPAAEVAAAILFLCSDAAATINGVRLPLTGKGMMNRLASQKSPYLLQHAGNPVDWYPWGEEAFEAARRDDKPVFLSIGYSTCHWCHVMESESFANPEVATLMNEAFISIKVDREERPDLDEHFMDVSRLLTGSGGWPLTILLTSDARAFYAATYIPRENAYGRMGMLELVPRIRDLWENRRGDVLQSADTIAAEIGKFVRHSGSGFDSEPGVVTTAARSLAAAFDSRHGGFGGAPKFPMPTLLSLLLRAWRRSGETGTLGMVEHTLAAMRSGGIFDQVGFGFHRYSTDARWHVPHFEKMLYDQALQCIAYTEGWQATGTEAWKETAKEICAYVIRDLTLPEGGFATAEDADSEGEEGRFYVWTEAEIRSILGANAAAFCARYGVVPGEQNILHREIADRTPPGAEEGALLAARARRTRPLRDDKILADWNGLMIAALARAGRVLGEPSLVEAADMAARFITGRMRSPDGGLFHRHRGGESGITGFADDYAFLAWGLLELYEATFEPSWLEECVALTEYFLANFWDTESGGFFSTTGAQEVSRRKSFTDGVIPSANSVGVLLLLTLNRMTGRADFEGKAEQLLRQYPRDAGSDAITYSFFLAAADFAAGPTFEVVIAGDRASADTKEMLAALSRMYLPNSVVLLRPPDGDSPVVRLAPYAAALRPLNGKATAYVCRDFTCSLPTNDITEMLAELTGDRPLPPLPFSDRSRP